MTDARWEQLAGLFERATAIPVPEREHFLANACGNDADLLASVKNLLAADAGGFPLLDATPDQMADAVAAAPESAASWRVGPYRLTRELGRGGMGVVYLAERDDLPRSVALKLLLRGPASSSDNSAWFRREQAVHAQLEHPHIARLLDAGVADDGTPWLVMEYVEGRAIDQHCDDGRLSVAERLALFEKVAEAVAYAHRNLVVHRDLKPSNILVTTDGDPKLVDFGIAKLLAPESAQGPLTHSTGGVLTLAYASPEQLRAGPITTATDVYQLGLLLHELLTGCPASDAQGRPLDHLARLRDHEPTRPSALVNLRGEADGLSQRPSPMDRSAVRRTTPERLRKLLEGDLDTIVLKAIRPDPAERYPSAQQLLDDVRRHRDGLPVLARPGSLRYRLGKLVRRHRVTAALLATLVVVLAGTAITLGIQARRVVRERDRADQFSRLLEGLIYGADPLGIADSQSARTVLDRTARQARARVAAAPEVWGRLLVAVGRTYANMGHLKEAIAAEEEALAALTGTGADQSPLVIEAMRTLGASQVRAGDLTGGIARLEEAVERSGRGGEASRGQYGASLADLGNARVSIDDLDSAASIYRHAVAVLASLPDSGGGEFDRLAVEYGNLLLQGSNLAAAEQLLSGATARLTAREGPESGATLHAKTELADILLKAGKLAMAERMATEVLDVRRRLSRGPNDPLAQALLQYGRSMAESGRMDEAERSMREAMGMWRELSGDVSFPIAYAQVQLADVLKRAGKVEGALTLEQNSQAQFMQLSGPSSAGVVYTTVRLARSEHLLGRLESAEQHFREVMPRLDSTPSGQGRLVRPLTDFGDLLADRGKCAEAEPYLERAMAIADHGWGPSHPMALRPRRLLGTCLGRRRQFPAAETVLLAAYRNAQAAGEYAPRQIPEITRALIQLYAAWGRPEEVERFRRAGDRR